MMTAYAVKDPTHITFIEFAAEAANCPSLTLDYVECGFLPLEKPICVCEVKKPVDVSIDSLVQPPPKNSIADRPGWIRPMYRSRAGDLSWLVRMKNVDHDQGKAGQWGDISGKVVAKLEFGWQS